MNLSQRLLLSIESSTSVGSVALHKGANLLASTTQSMGNIHDRTLGKMVEYLLQLTGHKAMHVGAVAIGAGPGSYTGLRIGTSFAKGFCTALNIPLFSKNTLSILLAHRQFYPHLQEADWCALMDARAGRLYMRLERSKGGVEVAAQIVTLASEGMGPFFSEKPLVCIGSGVDQYEDFFLNQSKIIPLKGHVPRAALLGGLIAHLGDCALPEDLAHYAPLYLGPGVRALPQAFRKKFEKKQ